MSSTSNMKLLRDISLKPRFRFNYGTNEGFFKKCIDYIKYWDDKLFYIEEESLRKNIEKGTLSFDRLPEVQDVNIPSMVANPIDKQELMSGCNCKAIDVEIQGNDSVEKLGALDYTELSGINRKGLILNTGGIVTSTRWLNKTIGNKQYLAVSIMTSTSDLKNIVGHDELGVFYNTTSGTSNSTIRSAIQIWEYDMSSNEFKLQKLFVTSKFGACSGLSWSPFVTTDPEILGVLGGLFKDGKLHFLKITTNGDDQRPQFFQLESSSLEYQMKNPRNEKERIGIISYDYLGKDKLIVGCSDGSIAEFIFPIDHNSLNDDLSIPSFVHNITETPITFVSTANPSDDKFLIQINTYGNQNFIFDYDSFQVGKLDVSTTSIKPQYNNFLKIFISSDSLDSVGYSFVRHPQDRPSLVLKTDGLITSFASSKLIGHPLVLVTNSFGEIFVVNIARKILTSNKVTNKLLTPLRIWKLIYKSPGSFSLDGTYEPTPPETSNKMAPSPEEVTISSIDWNENIEGCSIYAAGTHSGLLILERLDPNV